MSRDEEPLERLTLRLPPRTAAAVGRGTISLDGFRSDRVISECVRRTGSWEPAIMEVIVEKLPEGGTFIDVGANIGIHSMVAALRVGSHGRVLAVEASPVTYPLLEKNLAATGHPGVTTLHQAVWDQDAALAFCHQPNAPGGSHVGAGDGDAFLVPGRPLDDLVDAHGVTRVDVIKLDIEGAEMKALLGSQKTLQDKRPTLLMEVNPLPLLGVSGVPAADLYHWIRHRGYRVQVFTPAGLVQASDYSVLETLLERCVLLDVVCEPESV